MVHYEKLKLFEITYHICNITLRGLVELQLELFEITYKAYSCLVRNQYGNIHATPSALTQCRTNFIEYHTSFHSNY